MSPPWPAPAARARFRQPSGVAVAAAGTLVIADTWNHGIRQLTAAGTVTTLAGAGVAGFADGPASAARFHRPTGVAVDAAGQVIVADHGNHCIRRITPDGWVTTIAGAGVPGLVDGPATTAQFQWPSGVAVSSDGAISVADTGNHRIRMITPTGEVRTLAGSGYGGPVGGGFADGPAAAARFRAPEGLAVAAGGTVYVADTGNQRIRAINPQGKVTTVAGWRHCGGFADGPAGAALFNRPTGVAIDGQGNVYVADAANDRLRRITPDGAVRTVAGTDERGLVDGPAALARFDEPHGIAVDAAGRVYVTDRRNERIRRFDPHGRAAPVTVFTAGGTAVVATAAGSAEPSFADGPAATARFTAPSSIAVDRAGVLSVGDSGRVRSITPAGLVTTLAGGGPSGFADGPAATALFGSVDAVAVDAAGAIYVADAANDRIRTITPDGVVGSLGNDAMPAPVGAPRGVAVDAAGAVSIADLFVISHRTARGVVTTLAGAFPPRNEPPVPWGPAAEQEFRGAGGIAVDAAGAVYGADVITHRISRITAAGAVTVYAGADAAGFADGAAATARFRAPSALAIDRAGGLYVADSGNHRIRRVTRAGEVSTVAGAGVPGLVDGPAATAQFQRPSGVAVGEDGTISVADTDNQRIRLITPTGEVRTLAGAGRSASGHGTVWPRRGGGNVHGFADGPAHAAQFAAPQGIAVDASGTLVIADTGNHCIRTIGPDGHVRTLAGTGERGLADGPTAVTRFQRPSGVAVDAAGTIDVADTDNHRICRLAADGQVATLAGDGREGDADGPGAVARFHRPRGVDVDAAGTVYVADTGNRRIRTISPDGTVRTLAGPGRPGGVARVTADARLAWPAGVAVDAAGIVYVADRFGRRIRTVSPDGLVTTLAGSGIEGFADGPAATAQFSHPVGVAVDALGQVYVADAANHHIRQITPAGVVTTLAGGGVWGWVDGPAGTARFAEPTGVAVDGRGTVYVTDTANDRVRTITCTGDVVDCSGDLSSALGGATL